MAWHKESTRSSEEVRGSKRHRTRATESSRIEFSTEFAYLLAKWLISLDDHITEKSQSDNKTARKSTDLAYMKKARAAVESDIGIQSCSEQRVG